MSDDTQGSGLRIVVVLMALFIGAIVMMEMTTQRVLAEAADGTLQSDSVRFGSVLRVYLAMRLHVLRYWWIYGPLVLLGPPLALRGVRALSAQASRFRERFAGMSFEHADYGLTHPFAASKLGVLAATQSAVAKAMAENPEPTNQVVLGVDSEAHPVYLSDRARSMHVHLLGQTGSGKTQSAIYPLLFQDAWRGRSVLLLDAKGSIENEEFLARVGAATGRPVKIFTLNPGRSSLTYNPLHMPPGADPRAAAERIFGTFAEDMDQKYYRDLAHELFVNLVVALASTGKRFCLWDLAACVADEETLLYALSLASERRAVRQIESRLASLGDKFHQNYSGLLSALGRYDHPAVNAYAPDINLDDDVDAGTIIGFSLSANAYGFLARAVGILILQHLQQIGAARQMDRTRDQAPVYVYADEFYTFAYEGFIDAVNKLRDANISLLLAHQSLADLERVSPEYASAIWDNTRNKIVLYQNDSELCERLANSLGTVKATQLTVRRSADAWLNSTSMLEASSREVDEFILHPSQPKNLHIGQAYLVQAGIGETAAVRSRWRRKPVAARAAHARGVNLALMPPLPPATFPTPRPLVDVDDGLYLYRRFEQQGSAA